MPTPTSAQIARHAEVASATRVNRAVLVFQPLAAGDPGHRPDLRARVRR